MTAMRARLAVRIGPDDVGRRVTVRARHHGPDAAVTDIVGTLLTWDEATVTIARRDGSTAILAQHDLVAGRVVDRAPAPRVTPRPSRVEGEATPREDPER